MACPREWKLVFTCPTCEQASEVAAAKMEAVMSCPHCHTSVVIDRDGIHEAAKRIRQSRRKHQRKPEDVTYRRASDEKRGHGWPILLTLLPTIAVILSVTLWSKHRGLDDDGDLYSAAKMFQSAWLDDDLDTACTFVLASDRTRLQQWSAPRRAALVAGFGAKFSGRITTVEIVEKAGDHARVGVIFEVGGREQQVFQDWKRVDGSWRLCLK